MVNAFKKQRQIQCNLLSAL